MPTIKQRIVLISFLFFSFLCSACFTALAQEYKVISFNVVQDDLTAKTKPRVDNNGKKCAVIKVYVDDRISAVRGNIIGEVSTIGMEKSFYITDGSRKLELVFDNHYPLKIVFDDYNIPAITGAMTYVLKLKTDSSSSHSEPADNSDSEMPHQESYRTNQSSSSSSDTPANPYTGSRNKMTEYKPGTQHESTINFDSGDLQTYLRNGKQAFNDYDKQFTNKMINPQSVDNIKMGSDLLNGYHNYMNAYLIASKPDNKGKVDSKTIETVAKIFEHHANDFFIAGADFFNAKKFFPEAYECFLIYADMPDKEVMRGKKFNLPDHDRGTAYFNAGLAAYSGNSIVESADAFRSARRAGYEEKQAYIYEIACWQNLAQNDSDMEQIAKERIYEIAQEGDTKFGLSEPLFFNNIINYYVNETDYKRAIAAINTRVAQNQGNAGLYALLGFVYDKMGKHDESVAEYRKAASLKGADFETLINAAKKIYNVGSEKWNAIEGNTDSARASRRSIKTEYHEIAKKIAERAKIMNSENGDLNYLIESIDYALSLAD